MTSADGFSFCFPQHLVCTCLSWWAHKNQLSSVDEDEAELLKSVGSAFLFLVIGWFLGATIPALLPIMPKAWSLETGTALFIYASLFVESAFFYPAL